MTEAEQTVRDALHMLAKFEDAQKREGSDWPDGPHIFPGASKRALVALDVLLREERDEPTW